MRLSNRIRVLLTTILLLQSSSASAIELHVLGPTSAVIAPGETVTIDISMTAPAYPVTPELYGIAASVHGHGGGLQFVSGLAVPNFFYPICIAPGVCLGGLANIAGEQVGSLVHPSTSLRDLRQSEMDTSGMRVQIALASSPVPIPVSSFGLLPQGIDGEFGTPMFQLRFVDSSYQRELVVLLGGGMRWRVRVS